MAQAYLWRGPTTVRVRVAEGAPARLTVKRPRAQGRAEWEWRLPRALARLVLTLPLPRVEKTRLRAGRLEIDRLTWPEPMVLCELELRDGEPLDLADPAARARLMEAHRPAWVEAWEDVTDDPAFTNAWLARRRPWPRPPRGR